MELILPELGAHLSLRTRLIRTNELLAAPFPKAETTEEVLAIAAEVERRGYRVGSFAQRPLRLRAPLPGEPGIVVGETTDQAAHDKPKLYFFAKKTAATGFPTFRTKQPCSHLWFTAQSMRFWGPLLRSKNCGARTKPNLR